MMKVFVTGTTLAGRRTAAAQIGKLATPPFNPRPLDQRPLNGGWHFQYDATRIELRLTSESARYFEVDDPGLPVDLAEDFTFASKADAIVFVADAQVERSEANKSARARALGGDHSPPNLTTLCDGHHTHHHKGTLVISGRAPDALVFVRNGERLSGSPLPVPKPAEAHRRAPSPSVEQINDAQAALRQMGYKPAIAKRAVGRACAHVGAGAELVALIVEALKHCG